jgi:uncharacterized membrane protein (UPF0127 family)
MPKTRIMRQKMDRMKIYAGGREIACDIYEAKTFWQRFSGLMFKSRKYGLLIEKCSSVHTFFMEFNIDVVCLDEDYKIVEIFYGVKPFRLAASFKKTKHILELPSGAFDNSVIKPGISLKIVK